MKIQSMRNTASWLSALALAAQACAADPTLPSDGWASWQADAVEDAPAWCCWSSWDNHGAPSTPCPLDGKGQGFGSRDGASTDAVRVYARLESGKINRLRVLAASCPVESKTPIHTIEMTTEDSARWLIGVINEQGKDPGARGALDEEALAALAMHRGQRAQDALATLARTHTRTETRKKATFWLAELRGAAGAEVVSSVMFNDRDTEVRKHAAFAIAQSKVPRVAADLIRLGDTDQDGDVRSQAWFWLAHTGAAGAEEAILAAVAKDQDSHVREQAVFALSQLPDDRATRALIQVAENRTLSAEQRKRAVFWLAQSGSAGALTYLDKVLAGSATGERR
jgi:hypothetical protein